MNARSAAGGYRLGLLDGDGIGPEIVPAAARTVDAAVHAAGRRVEWIRLPVGLSAIEEFGAALPESTSDALGGLDGWLLGPHDNAAYPEPHRSQLNPSGTIRTRFGLYANIRPAKAFAGAPAVVPGTDLVIVRENTEGCYADRNTHAGTGEFMPTADVAIAHAIVTRPAVQRVAHTAFELARTRRGRLTVVHKANVLQLTSGMFLEVCREIGAQYPDVAVDDFHVDAMTAHLVRRADEFDVIVAENMFGDILSDLTAELAGSLGSAPSINASDRHGMAQAAHGSAPDIAGRGIANPTAVILSGAMLLDWLGTRNRDDGLLRAAELIRNAVERTVRAGTCTADVGGSAGTAEFAEAVTATITGS